VARGEYAGSGLTRGAWGDGGYRAADDLDTLATELLAALTTPEPPVLVYGYHPDLDRRGHEYGVGSAPWRAAAAGVDRLISRLVDGLPPDAALVVIADHGQLDVPAGHRFDLGTDPRLRAGLAVVAGEVRVRHLHTVPGAAGDVIAAWRGVLGDAAWVVGREEAVAGGWFGPVSDAHLPRVGDVVVVCRGRYAVLATGHEPERVARLVAFHGSWTADEMLVPLLVVRPTG
jgi:Type I phosphodiesterase / nucleotide pyrophosphatase